MGGERCLPDVVMPSDVVSFSARRLLELTHRTSFDELPDALDVFLQGKAHGRVVVEVAGA
jgi:hypothetical protein